MTPLSFSQQIAQKDLDFLGPTFVETKNQLQSLLCDGFNGKIPQKQLCQSRDRISDVEKTDKRILQAIYSDTNYKRKN